MHNAPHQIKSLHAELFWILQQKIYLYFESWFEDETNSGTTIHVVCPTQILGARVSSGMALTPRARIFHHQHQKGKSTFINHWCQQPISMCTLVTFMITWYIYPWHTAQSFLINTLHQWKYHHNNNLITWMKFRNVMHTDMIMPGFIYSQGEIFSARVMDKYFPNCGMILCLKDHKPLLDCWCSGELWL